MSDNTKVTNRKKDTKKPPPDTTTPPPDTKNYSPDSAGGQSFMKKVLVRSVAGAGMIAAFILVLYIGHDLLIFLMLIAQAITWKEIVSLRWKSSTKKDEEKVRDIYGFRSLQWFFLFLTYFYLYAKQAIEYYQPLIPKPFYGTIVKYHGAAAFALYVSAFLGLILSLRKESLKYQFSQVSWTLMSLLIVMGQSHFVVHNALKGLIWILFPHSLTICNDIMAYFCGITMGRKFIDKPLTKLSENKTWEGFIGALFFTTLFGFFFPIPLSKIEWIICPKTQFQDPVIGCVLDPIYIPTEYQLPAMLTSMIGWNTVTILPIQLHGVVLALFASLIAPFGGILASGIKRAYGIKDYNQLIPGHGGLTDRMDCQFIMASFVYIYYTTFINSSLMGPESIINHLRVLPREDQLKVFGALESLLKST